MTNRIASLDKRAYLYEQKAWTDQRMVIGVDEVGRGCLAGPVVAAAVVLKVGEKHSLLRDSKKLTPKQRQDAWFWIQEHAYAWGIGIVDHKGIDQHRIVESTRRAMRRSVSQLFCSADLSFGLIDHILVDALDPGLDYFGGKTIFFNHGEDLSISIAAASIVAKVYRDGLLGVLESTFVSHAFMSHKGYGTAAHQLSLKNNGRCLIHRNSFLKD